MIAPAMSVESLIVIVAALLIGSIGKAITGFGLPLIAIPVMAVFIGVETAVVVMVIPATYSNVVLLREFRGSVARLRGLWLAIGIGLAGIAIGTWLLKTLEPGILSLVLSGWIGVYLLTQISGINVPVRIARGRGVLSATIGIGGICQGATGIAGPIVVTMLHAMKLERPVLVFACSGADRPRPRSAVGHHRDRRHCQGATGIAGPIVVTMLHAMKLERPVLVFAFSAVFFAYGVAQIASMAVLGLFTWERFIQGLIALIPVVIGLPVGLWLGRRISARAFNICVIVLLSVMGLKLAHDGIAVLGL